MTSDEANSQLNQQHRGMAMFVRPNFDNPTTVVRSRVGRPPGVGVAAMFVAIFTIAGTISAYSQTVAKYDPLVFAAQQFLSQNYHPGTADGLMGKNTHAAITQFQKDHGLSPTGNLDQPTLISMGLASPKTLDPFVQQFGTISSQLERAIEQIPEIADGVNAKEAGALDSIYGTLKGTKLPQDVFQKQPWESNDISNVVFRLERTVSGRPAIIRVHLHDSGKNKPVGYGSEMLETDDTFKEDKGQFGTYTWVLNGMVGDVDIVKIKLANPDIHKPIDISANSVAVPVTPGEALHGKNVSIYGVGELKISIGSSSNVPAQTIALTDMIRLTKGGDYSRPLQAMEWAAEAGKIKDVTHLLASYVNFADLTKHLWSLTKDEKSSVWRNYNSVMDIIGARPEFVSDYLRDKVIYISNKSTFYPQQPEITFRRKWGDCKAYAWFADEALSRSDLAKGGYKFDFFSMDYYKPKGHTVALIKVPKGDYFLDSGMYVITSPGFGKSGFAGPYPDLNAVEIDFGYSLKAPHREETLRGMNRRFGRGVPTRYRGY